MHRTIRTIRTIGIALLALGPAAAWGGEGETPSAPAAAPAAHASHASNASNASRTAKLADVDLDDVPVHRALRLLSEIYDVSIATGQLPDTRVTVRLRRVGVREAFESVAAAAGLTATQEGEILRLSPRTTVEAAAAALGDARQGQLVLRVFPLGVAPGEETLKTVQPLLEPHFEVASYDATAHRLTVSALPATMARIEALLAELTRAPAQFEIEVRVVEVAKSALERIGAQGSFGLDVSGGVLATTFPLAGLSDSRRYLPSPNDLATLRGIGGGGGGGSTSGSGGTGTFADSGFRFGRIDGSGIRLLIEALEQSGEARVVATPKVTALDNHRAKISMVTTLRIPTFTQNQAFATTTVSGIEQIDVGTTLEVFPRKGEGRQILLKVTPEVSELSTQVSSVTQGGLTQGLPVVNRRRTETEVILGGGETLVIGGLVTERETKTTGKTPGLADIPLLGRAFRLEGKTTDKTELLVFVTPRELPPPEERRIKARVDDAWIPAGLAAQVDGARAQIHGRVAAERTAGVRLLEELDRDLLAAGVDVGRDVAGLGTDPSLEVRVAALLFLLHERPANALGELVRFADSRAVALAVLTPAIPVSPPIAPHLRAALAELVTPAAGGTEARGSRATEPALGWSGTPAEIVIHADPANPADTANPSNPSNPSDTALVRAALDLLARRAPDLRHLVGFGLATIDTGGRSTGVPGVPGVDPAVRSARVTARDITPEQLALQLVRLAMLVFEVRVRGLEPASGNTLAGAVREEIVALERLTGASCSPERAAATVARVLQAAHLEERP